MYNGTLVLIGNSFQKMQQILKSMGTEKTTWLIMWPFQLEEIASHEAADVSKFFLACQLLGERRVPGHDFCFKMRQIPNLKSLEAVECWGMTVVDLRFRIDLSLPLFRLIRILETNCHSVCASRNYAYAVLGPIIIHTTTHRHCQGKLDWKRFVFLWALPFKIVVLWKMGRMEL